MARSRLLNGKWLLSSSASQKPSANFPKVAIAGIEHAVEHRVPPQRIGQQILEILEADENAAPADGGVGEGEPDAEAERVGEEHRQQPDRRRQAHHDQERLVVEQPDEPARLPVHQGAVGGEGVSLRTSVCGRYSSLRAIRRSNPWPPEVWIARRYRPRNDVAWSSIYRRKYRLARRSASAAAASGVAASVATEAHICTST